MKFKHYFASLFGGLLCLAISSQEYTPTDSLLVQGLKLRGIGPAFASGRIADFAVNPGNPSEYYVAVASGNIWKTVNKGTTWKPVFDDYGCYSVACLAMDPNNPKIIYAGTGENNSQRALGYGDGVYKSTDGGKKWKNLGLKNSRQIGKILIDPRNTSVVYVAAEGSVWGPGEERGVYKSTNGGADWIKILSISENTGVRDIVFHPKNPDIIYAASHQRRRRGFTKINGGPESAIYKTIDGGKNWEKTSNGLPGEHLGAIGLAVTPANPNLVYAIVEANAKVGGFYRSNDQGETWERMGDYFSRGAQYYHELFCDPKNENKVYSMDTRTKVTLNGGKTWKNLSYKARHVDDHALWINPQNTDNLLIGGDGGIYESYDGGTKWNFKSNLPVTQFYRVNVDTREPFYHVYGGTQDNNTVGGPSRNTKKMGVVNSEWNAPLGGDGFWVAIDPEDPNTVYCEYQYGNAYRINMENGDAVYIKPQEKEGELTYKWNWDAPLILSPHSNKRLYMAANKVFRSDDKGESWKTISDDLTTKVDRNSFKVMGKYWSSDAVAKDVSTSQWGTIVSFAESRVTEGLLYAGTDDGLIHISEDGGDTWRKAKGAPGVPEYTYVSDLLPSKFDENVVFASFNNHKSDDFTPYLFVSKDKGKSWKKITEGLPENGPVHTIEQDYIDKNLLFCGTEWGVYTSLNSGKNWIQIKKGIPTISVKDMVIQETESDLVLATFGRGFYLLENYSALRSNERPTNNLSAKLFPIKDAWLYKPLRQRNYFGDSYFISPNPPYGAEIRYFLNKEIKSTKQQRKQLESEQFKKDEKIRVISWGEARAEEIEEQNYLLFVIRDSEGNIIRKLSSKAQNGLNKIYWDLSYPQYYPVSNKTRNFNPFAESKAGLNVLPGSYSVGIYLSTKGKLEELVPTQAFKVKALPSSNYNTDKTLKSKKFREELRSFCKEVYAFRQELGEFSDKIAKAKQTLLLSEELDPARNSELVAIETEYDSILLKLKGHKAKASNEEIPPSEVNILVRLEFILETAFGSSTGTTASQEEAMKIAQKEYAGLKIRFSKLKGRL